MAGNANMDMSNAYCKHLPQTRGVPLLFNAVVYCEVMTQRPQCWTFDSGIWASRLLELLQSWALETTGFPKE